MHKAKEMIGLRKAEENDIKTLLEFEEELIEYERDFNKNLKDPPFHYYDILELIRSTKAEVIVAIVDDEIAGSGYAKIKDAKAYEKNEYYGHLGFMYVKPSHRRKGINQMIMSRLIDWVKGQGLGEVMLDVYAENKAAVHAYQKIGLKPKMITMNLKI